MADGLPCAWGAIKALAAFAQVPASDRSPAVGRAVEAGVRFLLDGEDASTSLDPDGYPTAAEPSPLWLKFGFPLGHTSDLVELLDVLAQLGLGQHPRVAAAIALVQAEGNETGRWTLQYTPQNTWADFGRQAQPNKWVTLRALRALKRCGHWAGTSGLGDQATPGQAGTHPTIEEEVS
jgi:hypothetical protein